MAKRKKAEVGRITLPRGKTANERAKEKAEPAVLKNIQRALTQATEQANLRMGETREGMLAGISFVKQFLNEK